jgi:zinc-ribbon domain
VFCPNCGTKNDDTATPCTKCGFKLSGAAAPKFRGTMMLNTEQSVQEMVEEHRRKLGDEGTVQEPAKGPGAPGPSAAQAPLSAPGSTKSPLQPARTGLPKRRMGTMLGVAPQGGEIRPAHTPTPPPPSPLPASAEDAPPSAPNPLGGTIAFAGAPPAPPPRAHPLAAGRTEAFAGAPASEAARPAQHPLAAGRTEAFEAVPAVAAAPAHQALAAERLEAVAAAPEPAATAPATRALAGRTEAFDAPLAEHEQTPAPASARADRDSLAPAAGLPQRLRPLDVFLIVITCGLYALVIWARQRKSS